MATHQQKVHNLPPLNAPPPLHTPPSSQPPPRKKLRHTRTKPKLTVEQVTTSRAIQAAIDVGRRTNRSKDDNITRLHSLLSRMQTWAKQVAPEYPLSEFVVAAAAMSGNRALRPVLADVRLAELRQVEGTVEGGTGGVDVVVPIAERVEQNRLRALERRKVTMERLAKERGVGVDEGTEPDMDVTDVTDVADVMSKEQQQQGDVDMDILAEFESGYDL